MTDLQNFALMKPYDGEQLLCEGCENKCVVHRFRFENGNSYYSGNKCEKVYTNKGNSSGKGNNRGRHAPSGQISG